MPPPGLLTTDLSTVLNDPEIEAVVQLIGGLEPDRSIMLKVLQSGKNVITANKALLAEHGRELFDCARRVGRTIAFEAAVGGGIPVIAAINQSLVANQIQSIHGILNGTSNFILTQMEDFGKTYADALAEAQQLGYAEANPAMDVNGSDAAQKLAILAHLSFGARVDWKIIPRIGIDTVDVADMRYARELGYSIKLLAVAELVPGGTGAARLADAGAARLDVGPGARGVQRHPHRGRRRGPRLPARTGGGTDAHRLGLRGRPDRHAAGPHGHHLPHAASSGPTIARRRWPSAIRPASPAGSTSASTSRTGPA